MKNIIFLLFTLVLASCAENPDSVYNYEGAVIVGKSSMSNLPMKLQIRYKNKDKNRRELYRIEWKTVSRGEYNEFELNDTVPWIK